MACPTLSQDRAMAAEIVKKAEADDKCKQIMDHATHSKHVNYLRTGQRYEIIDQLLSGIDYFQKTMILRESRTRSVNFID